MHPESGAALAVVGAVLIVVSFTALDWFSGRSSSKLGGAGKSHFSDLHDFLNVVKSSTQGVVEPGTIAAPYFTWLGWVLLAVAVIAAVVACLPTGASSALRALGLLLGLAGAGLTFWAIDLAKVNEGAVKRVVSDASQRAQIEKTARYSTFFDHASIGFWFAVAGFVVVGVGAVIGPRRS